MLLVCHACCPNAIAAKGKRMKPRAQLGWGKQQQQVLLSWGRGRREAADLMWKPQRLTTTLPVCEYQLVSLQPYKCTAQLHQTPGVCKRRSILKPGF